MVECFVEGICFCRPSWIEQNAWWTLAKWIKHKWIHWKVARGLLWLVTKEENHFERTQRHQSSWGHQSDFGQFCLDDATSVRNWFRFVDFVVRGSLKWLSEPHLAGVGEKENSMNGRQSIVRPTRMLCIAGAGVSDNNTPEWRPAANAAHTHTLSLSSFLISTSRPTFLFSSLLSCLLL